MTAIVVKNARIYRMRTLFVEQINVKTRGPELLALVGSTPAARRSTLLTLAGFVPLSQGSIRLDGHALGDKDAPKVGFLPAEGVLPGTLTCQRALGYAAEIRLRHLELDARRERLVHTLEDASLGEVLSTRVDRLAPTMRKRAEIASELLDNPALLLLDEPFVALDDDRDLWDWCRELVDTRGISILVSAPSVERDLVDRLIYLGD